MLAVPYRGRGGGSLQGKNGKPETNRFKLNMFVGGRCWFFFASKGKMMGERGGAELFQHTN